MAKKKAKMPHQADRLQRIEKNFEKLPRKQRQNILSSKRGKEILKHATGKANVVAHSRPQDKVRRG